MAADYQNAISLCRLIKSELEPHMQQNLPRYLAGLTFERLSLGAVPFSILGVRHNPSLNSDHLSIGKHSQRFIAVHICQLHK